VAWRLKAYDSPIGHVLSPDSLEVVLNGAGVRANAFFRVYVVGVYLVEKIQPEEILVLQGGKRQHDAGLHSRRGHPHHR
jgi:hypothetical protein